jgi:hypothetical protein
MRITNFLPIMFLLLDACIDPLPVHTLPGGKVLVVDGLISDEPGPYEVKLFWSSALTENLDQPVMETKASVWIIDDENVATEMTESMPGVYVTDPHNFVGQKGKTYQLKIITSGGLEFESLHETLMPAGSIDSLYFTFQPDVINANDATQPQDAVTIFVDASAAPDNPTGLSRWRSTGIYEVHTFPELRTRMENEMRVPDPLPCSGYINVKNELVQVEDCSCCDCWVYEYNSKSIVSQNQFVQNNQFKSVSIAQIPVDQWRFYRKYHIEVEQLSVSENVYEFWKRLAGQQAGTGSVFQPNAVRIEGNIRCVSDPDIEAFGVFSASGVVRKSMFIHRYNIPRFVAPPDTITFDCRFSFDDAKNERPPFW